jgi:hypothetical protein
MATDSVMGLFASPEQYQQQQRQALYDQAVKEAQLDPYQQARVNLQTGVQGLAQTGAGMLGAQDPQMKLQAMRQQILQGLDQTDPKSMMESAQKLAQAGDNQGASQLANAAREAALQLAKANQENTAATKNLREATPAAVREYQVAKAEGYPGSFVDFQTQMNQSKRNLTNVSIDSKGETAFAQELGKLDAKKVTDAVDARQGAIGLIKAVNELDKLDNAGLVSGSFASGRVGVANFLNTAGLASPEEAKKLANSQSYQKVAGDVILGNLGGKLGAGVSEGDRKFVEGLVPQLETSPDARRQLIQYMRNKGLDVIKESSRLESYARKNKGLSGYEPELPLKMPEVPVAPVGGQGWSIKKVP